MTVHQTILALLNQHGVPYNLLQHEPSRTSAESAQMRGDSTQNGAKALCLKVNGTYILFVLRAYRKLDLEKVQQLTGVKAKKVRFASAEELMQLTTLLPGSVPPFGEPVLPMPLYIDESIVEGDDLIGFNAGLLTTSIKMQKQDYLRVAGGHVASFSTVAG